MTNYIRVMQKTVIKNVIEWADKKNSERGSGEEMICCPFQGVNYGNVFYTGRCPVLGYIRLSADL